MKSLDEDPMQWLCVQLLQVSHLRQFPVDRAQTVHASCCCFAAILVPVFEGIFHSKRWFGYEINFGVNFRKSLAEKL